MKILNTFAPSPKGSFSLHAGQPLICFLSLWIGLRFLEFYINGIMWCGLFLRQRGFISQKCKQLHVGYLTYFFFKIALPTPPRCCVAPTPSRWALLLPAAHEFHLNFNAEPFGDLFVSLTSVNPYP